MRTIGIVFALLIVAANSSAVSDYVQNLNGVPFKTGKSDGTKACAKNSFSIYAKRIIRNWDKEGTCNKQEAPFKGKMIISTAPFAFQAACYRTEVFCAPNGDLFAKYYEWMSEDEAKNVKIQNPPGIKTRKIHQMTEQEKALVKEAFESYRKTGGDNSARCPSNTCTFKVKTTLQEFKNTQEQCKAYQGRFKKGQMFYINPFPFKKKCFAQVDYCYKGKVKQKILEMKAYRK